MRRLRLDDRHRTSAVAGAPASPGRPFGSEPGDGHFVGLSGHEFEVIDVCRPGSCVVIVVISDGILPQVHSVRRYGSLCCFGAIRRRDRRDRSSRATALPVGVSPGRDGRADSLCSLEAWKAWSDSESDNFSTPGAITMQEPLVFIRERFQSLSPEHKDVLHEALAS